jgi:predicted membrane protein
MDFNFCAPAVIYAIFSLCQVLIDLSMGLYNTALIKCVVAIIISILLNWLCQSGLGIVSWVIVFIPFILMTFIVAMLLYIFGLKATTGMLIDTSNNQVKQQPQSQPQNQILTYPTGSTSPEYQAIGYN